MAEPFDAANLGMNASATTRRAALAALAAPIAAQSAVNTDGIAEVITLAAEKNAAFMLRRAPATDYVCSTLSAAVRL